MRQPKKASLCFALENTAATRVFDPLFCVTFARNLQQGPGFLFHQCCLTIHLSSFLSKNMPSKQSLSRVKHHTAMGHVESERLACSAKNQEDTSTLLKIAQPISAERFIRSIVDALPARICVLDEMGTIVAVNKAWRDFAGAYASVSSQATEGANYLAVCDAVTVPQQDAQEARAFAAGIRAVIRGESQEFVVEYVLNTPSEQRWFAGRVTRFPEADSIRLVIAHEDISERKWAEQASRKAIDAAEGAQKEAIIARQQAEKRRQEAEQRRQIAECLRDILSILNSNQPFDEVLNYIVSQAVRLLGSQAAAVYSRQGEVGPVVIQAEQGLPAAYIASVKLPANQPALRQAMLHPQPVAIPDLMSLVTSKDHPVAERALVILPMLLAPYSALLGVPIIIKNEVYGHVRLYYTEPRSFSKEEIELAIVFSDQVALAIENARLRDQVKQAAIIDERHRLARDLHDAVTQTIISANMIAEALPRIWERRPDEGRRSLEELHRLTQRALVEMRTLLLELRPAAIIEKKLGELLKQLLETVTSQTKIATTLTVEGDQRLPVDTQIALYRIAQESLNNILKHAGASQIKVTLQHRPEGVCLHLSDNGSGFDLNTIRPDQLGVSIMRERAMSVGAEFNLISRPGQGTHVLVSWPESGICAGEQIRHAG